MKTMMFKGLLAGILLATTMSVVEAQNVTITDDSLYKADTSALLDIKSTTKGLLVPRMGSTQRAAIVNPANGLMVFDTNQQCFYFFSQSKWSKVSYIGGLWSMNDSMVFLSDTTLSLGIGTTNPNGKFEVKADNSQGPDDPLFEVKDKNGDVVFGVYPSGVRVYIDTTQFKGARGGFAVGGRRSGKGDETPYLRVTPDSVLIWINDYPAKGARGGFAVGGRRSRKGDAKDYLSVSSDSIRIYLDQDSAKGARGGFAVGGRRSSKGYVEEYLRVTDDSVRVYTSDTLQGKGARGGFAVGGRRSSKGDIKDYFSVSTASSTDVFASAPRVLWYPKKEAFMAGRVLILSPDNVGLNSWASGFESMAKGNWSQALGYKASALGDYSTAIGKYAKATSAGSFAFGDSAIASLQNAFSFGKNSNASGNGSYSFGINSNSSGTNAFAMGYLVTSSSSSSFALGNNVTASGASSIAIGNSLTASGNGAFVAGVSSNAYGNYSTVIGRFCTANYDNSVAVGYQCNALLYRSTAIGYKCTANGNDAFAIGYEAEAGDPTLTYGSAYAFGYQAKAAKRNSFAIGDNVLANAYKSMVFGVRDTTVGEYSTAMGFNLRTGSLAEFVVGAGNVRLGGTTNSWVETDPLFVVANGLNGYSNALTILKGGKMGLGTSAPAYKLDVVGRSRFQAGSGSAGFWLMNNANSLDRSFIGMLDDNYVGMYGNAGAGWNLVMNVASGYTGIGTSAPAYKFDVSGDIRSTGKIYANANGAAYFQGGDDAEIWDVNVANTLAIYGLQNSALATLRLGSGAADISGSGGNVGIGTIAPTHKLEVVGTIAGFVTNGTSAGTGQFQAWTTGSAQGQRAVYSFYPTFQGTTDNYPRRAADIVGGFNGGAWGYEYLAFNVGRNGASNDGQTATLEKMRITSGGNVGIGTTTPGITYKLYVSGSAYCTGSWASSDIRWKKNVKSVENIMPRLLQLNSVNFEWNREGYPDLNFDEGTQLGLIAQEVEEVFPELVKTNDDGFKAVGYDKLTVLLLEGMKEQQREIDAQQKEIKELRTQLKQQKSLQSQIDELKLLLKKEEVK